MSIEIYRTAWGLTGPRNLYPSLLDFVDSAHDAGYDGVEFPVFYMESEPGGSESVEQELKARFETHDLGFVALIATKAADWGDYNAHLESFRSQAEVASRMGATKAAVHAGADSFGVERGQAFLEDCLTVSRDLGIAPCFETHRARILYNPFTCATLLERIPALELTSDLSHWLLVVDRVPHDIMDLFDLASARTGHLHARVGHEKSPQVTEPSDSAWDEHNALYRRWWQISVDAQADKGLKLTISPEFGPPPYMHAEPFTGKPSADIVAVNQWMREKLQEWFVEEIEA